GRLDACRVAAGDDLRDRSRYAQRRAAATFWARKSDLAAPGVPSLRMEITETNRRTRPMPFAGGFANGGAQTPDGKNAVDAYQAEVMLRLLGVESAIGSTGRRWPARRSAGGRRAAARSPSSIGPAICISSTSGGTSRRVAGVKGAWMAAWSS